MAGRGELKKVAFQQVHHCAKISTSYFDLQASAKPSTFVGVVSGDQTFTSVSLGMGDVDQAKKKKVPRRILHFSDGILEEYSTDEDEDESDKASLQPAVDPVSF